MGRGRVVPVVVAALLALSGSACSDGAAGPSGATVPQGDDSSSTTSSTSSTTVASVSYEVPEVIDQAYVQRVVSAYDQVLGDAIRVLKRDGALTEEFLHHLLAIYTEEEFEVHQRAWAEAVADGRLRRTPDMPGNPSTLVHHLVEATPTCIIVRADTDLRATLVDEPEESPQDDYIVLVRKQDGRDPQRLNPTPWVMSFDGAKNDGSVPKNSCAA